MMDVQAIRSLRRAGKHEEARTLAARLAATSPQDALVQYEAACIHDYLGLESEAVPYYVRAITAGLPNDLLRSAYVGLGSTYRVLERFLESLGVLDQGLAEFPQAREIIVFRAMTLQNLGRGKQAVEALLRVVAETADDPDIQEYSRAIEQYAQDVERTGP